MTSSNLTVNELEDLIGREYGFSGQFSRLPGENENYHLHTGNGDEFVLKISAPNYALSLFELENSAIEAAQVACPDLELPRTIKTLRGGRVVPLAGTGSDGPRFARLFDFVHGTNWSESGPLSAECAYHFGIQAARLANGLATLDLPAAHRTHRWDLANADFHRPSIYLIDDQDRRHLASRAFLLWSACAAPYLTELPHTLIHGDLNDENLRVVGNRLHGILDFADCLINPTICDLAIALAYLLFEQSDPFLLGAYVVEGYHRIHPLYATELEILFPLICGRLAMSVAMAAKRRRIDPDRTTWFVTEPKAWETLERYMEFDPIDVSFALASRTDIEVFRERGASQTELLSRRSIHISTALSLTYRDPVKFIRGRGAYLMDERGQPYLDLYNNVPHVGHCHPRVVEAAQSQIKLLNTNTRYLYDSLIEYAERLCATLPASLDQCFLVNSGSEANELALRLAAAYTLNQDVLVLNHAYHGHTGKLIEISPYKFMGPGGAGKAPPWVHVLPTPDGYRGSYRGQGRETGLAYGEGAARLVQAIGRPISAIICETLPSCAGQIIPPDGYFETVFPVVRETGGVCIMDEVQVGFGRIGTHFWAFERYGVIPDIVVMGKPIGNGHPLGAVVTTREIAESLARDGMEFFSTFGGNTVSCAIGLAVLDVIHDENLQENALVTGNFLRDGLLKLMDRHPLIGDVRGIGLFLGIELVKDRVSLDPAGVEADLLVNGLRDRHILAGTDGPHHNVIKIKPPLVISQDDASMAVEIFDEVLETLPYS